MILYLIPRVTPHLLNSNQISWREDRCRSHGKKCWQLGIYSNVIVMMPVETRIPPSPRFAKRLDPINARDNSTLSLSIEVEKVKRKYQKVQGVNRQISKAEITTTGNINSQGTLITGTPWCVTLVDKREQAICHFTWSGLTKKIMKETVISRQIRINREKDRDFCLPLAVSLLNVCLLLSCAFFLLQSRWHHFNSWNLNHHQATSYVEQIDRRLMSIDSQRILKWR